MDGVCTLAIAFRMDPRWPVVVAANRDEHLARAAEGWALREGGYAAPRDAVAGGTWIGVSARGVLAALTNFHAREAWYPDPARRSRGELVPEALRGASAAEARETIAALDLSRWNPFHLAVADGRAAFLAWYDGQRSGIEPLAPGLHVVTENAWDGSCPRAALVRSHWPRDPALEPLRALLTLHAPVPAPGLATCIHGDPAYGTRSSTVLRLAPDLAASDLWVADERPCTAPYVDRSGLLRALARGA
jgi:uncharacterized protein with NRDE domain